MWWALAGFVILLICSNIFQNLAWYMHLNIHKIAEGPVIYAILFSWCIAFVEYMFMVPANRLAAPYLNVSQMKILQEMITLTVFIPISILFFHGKWSWDFIFAALCMVGAVFFTFRSQFTH